MCVKNKNEYNNSVLVDGDRLMSGCGIIESKLNPKSIQYKLYYSNRTCTLHTRILLLLCTLCTVYTVHIRTYSSTTYLRSTNTVLLGKLLRVIYAKNTSTKPCALLCIIRAGC